MPATTLLYPSMGLADDEHLEVTLSGPARIASPTGRSRLRSPRSSAAPQPMPIVVLSHGGAFGKTNPRQSLEQWARVLGEHGYLGAAIAHTSRTDIERIVLTMNLGGTLPCRSAGSTCPGSGCRSRSTRRRRRSWPCRPKAPARMATDSLVQASAGVVEWSAK